MKEVSFEKKTYDFGDLRAGSNLTLDLNFQNKSSESITNCQPAVLSNPKDFVILSSTCDGANLAPHQTCQVKVMSQASSEGNKQTDVSVSCSKGLSIVTDAAVVKTKATEPYLKWDWYNEDIHFNEVFIDEEIEDGDYFFNIAETLQAVNCTAPAITDTVNFSISTDNCGANSLVAGDGCDIYVKTHLKSLGTHTAKLSRTCEIDGVKTTLVRNFIATGIPDGPRLSKTPNPWEYSLKYAQVHTENLTISNTGTSDAVNCQPAQVNYPSHVEIVSETCGATIPAGVDCNLQVRFLNNFIGVRDVRITKACDSVQARFDINNESKLDVEWKLALGFNHLGNYSLGSTSREFSAYFVNKNDRTLTGCTAPELTDSNNYTITSSTCTSGMPANGICEVKVAANPIVIGFHSSELKRKCDDSSVASIGFQSSGTDTGVSVQKVIALRDAGCALLSNGKIKCWGTGQNGLLGYGGSNPNPLSLAYQVDTATDIVGYNAHVCALLSDSTVKCWGANNYGQLGDGSTTNRLTPVTVSGINNAAKLFLGYDTSCALLTDKTVKCWGSNSYGQLGDGTKVQRETPVAVSGLTQVKQVVSGSNYNNCALLEDKTVKCWGYNYYGQIGD